MMKRPFPFTVSNKKIATPIGRQKMNRKRSRRRMAALAVITTGCCWQFGCIQTMLAVIGASFF